MTGVAHPITATVGLEVTGATAGEVLQAGAAGDLRVALDRHGVLIYREADLTDDELLVLSRALGEVVVQPTGEHRIPEIQTITLDPSKTGALLASYRQGNFQWHIDGATQAVPQQATLLSAQEVDPAGGDTEFASTYAAYDALDHRTKSDIAGLAVVHTFAHAQSLANPTADDALRRQWDRVPPQTHPLVWTRASGRKSLLLGATADRVVGWSAERSRELLDELLAWSTRPEFVVRQTWHKGDLVIWDNTGMLHRAMPFEPSSVRLLHRTTLAGEAPVSES